MSDRLQFCRCGLRNQTSAIWPRGLCPYCDARTPAPASAVQSEGVGELVKRITAFVSTKHRADSWHVLGDAEALLEEALAALSRPTVSGGVWRCRTCEAMFPAHPGDGPDCTRCSKCVEVEVLTAKLAALSRPQAVTEWTDEQVERACDAYCAAVTKQFDDGADVLDRPAAMRAALTAATREGVDSD